MSRLRVAVLSGGRSSEHEISVASAASVVDGLREAGFDAVPIEITREGRWSLPRAPHAAIEAAVENEGPPAASLPIPAALSGPALLGAVDVVFPVLHGPFGEDGTVQGLLELADVAYVGAGVAASAVAMDKDLFKAVMRANDVPVTRSVTVLARARCEARNPFDFPVVVKPARLGSERRNHARAQPRELEPALELAFAHDEKVLLEEYVARARRSSAACSGTRSPLRRSSARSCR